MTLTAPGSASWHDAAARHLLRWLSENEDAARAWVRARRGDGLTPRAVADEARRAAATRSARVGFVVGFADFLGPAGFAAATGGDLVVAARTCIEMGQRIAAAFGHDISSPAIQVRILEALAAHRDDGPLTDDRQTAARRAAERYVSHAVHRAVGTFLRRLLRTWSRRLLLAWVPLLGSVVNWRANRELMDAMGARLTRELGGQRMK